jgi:hypothetical protein
MKREAVFKTEADLVAAFCRHLQTGVWGEPRKDPRWKIYHETAGFDLLLVDTRTGVQVGLEAKLVLNVKVLVQILPEYSWREEGPDYRGVLVPEAGKQAGLSEIASRLGIGVIAMSNPGEGYTVHSLPDEARASEYGQAWHPWLPTRRCPLPDYVPDVVGGKPAPLKLTEWKIQAIKLLILLERRGAVSRATMKLLRLSPTRWTAPGGYLAPGLNGYVRCEHTPDFKAQHPKAWAEIEADFEKWAPPELPQPKSALQALLERNGAA